MSMTLNHASVSVGEKEEEGIVKHEKGPFIDCDAERQNMPYFCIEIVVGCRRIEHEHDIQSCKRISRGERIRNCEA
jgi:hypothetical protein